MKIHRTRLKSLVGQVFNDSKGLAGSRTVAFMFTHQHGIKLARYMASRYSSPIVRASSNETSG